MADRCESFRVDRVMARAAKWSVSRYRRCPSVVSRKVGVGDFADSQWTPHCEDRAGYGLPQLRTALFTEANRPDQT